MRGEALNERLDGALTAGLQRLIAGEAVTHCRPPELTSEPERRNRKRRKNKQTNITTANTNVGGGGVGWRRRGAGVEKKRAI